MFGWQNDKAVFDRHHETTFYRRVEKGLKYGTADTSGTKYGKYGTSRTRGEQIYKKEPLWKLVEAVVFEIANKIGANFEWQT